MEFILQDWLHLVLRWLHIAAAIAWVGTSFFFNFLDLAAKTPKAPGGKADAEAWLVHAGTFYQIDRTLINRDIEATKLGWESQVTWFSGVALLILIYYVSANLYLIDPSSPFSATQTIAMGVLGIAISWFVYDALWESPIAGNDTLAIVLSLALLCGLTYALFEVMSPRGATIHVGAMLGTLMWANVRVRIIPIQVRMIAETRAGDRVAAEVEALAHNAKRRSTHNNYMTLPVLLVMISNHFPGVYAHPHNWLLILMLFLAGALMRHAVNRHHQGKDLLLPSAAAIAVFAAVFIVAYARPSASGRLGVAEAAHTSGLEVSIDDVRPIIVNRCTQCHAAEPAFHAFAIAPKGVTLSTDEDIAARAAMIGITAVDSNVMPPGNLTGMTADERRLLGEWIRQGAKIN
jgi:uncharacterized membrane protein